MKKRWIPLLLIGLMVFLGGCAKSIPTKEAAALFVDRLIYQKETEKFEANFKDGAKLTETFEEQEQSFQENFTAGLLSTDSGLSQETANEISQLVMDQVKEKTSYTIDVAENDNIRNVTYHVKGLDFVALMSQTTQAITAQMLKDTSLAKDEAKLAQALVTQLKTALADAPVKNEAVDVLLEMRPEKGKWTLVDGQQEQLQSLYLAFVAGVKDEETLATDWATAQEKLAEELAKELQ